MNAREEAVVGFDQAFNRATGRARRKTLDNIFFSVERVRAKERLGEKEGQASFVLVMLGQARKVRWLGILSRITRPDVTSSGCNLDCASKGV